MRFIRPIGTLLVVLVLCSSASLSAQSPSTSASPGERLGAILLRADDAYARDRAEPIGAFFLATRALLVASSNAPCRTDALAHIDAVEGLLRAHPAAARYAIAAAHEVILRRNACEASACDARPDAANAHARAVLWLSLSATVDPVAETTPTFRSLLAGARAESEDDDAGAVATFREAAASARCPIVRADVMRMLAAAQRNLPAIEESRATIDQALALLPSRGGARQRGDLLLARGFTFASQRDFQQAAASYERAVEQYVQLGEHGVLLVASASTTIGVALGELGRPDDSILYNLRAMQVRIEALGESHPDYLINLSNIAIQRSRRGDHAGALEAHQRIYGIRARILSANDPALAVSLEAIGATLVRLGRADEAEQHCVRAIAVRDAGTLTVDRPRGHTCRAGALFSLGRVREALDEVTMSVELARAAQGRDHRDLIGYLMFQATCADRLGDAVLAASSRAEAARIRAIGAQ